MTRQSFVMLDSRNPERRWRFLTNHAHALVYIAADPGIEIQEIAERVGITLRAAQNIVTDLPDARYITRSRVDDLEMIHAGATARITEDLDQESTAGGTPASLPLSLSPCQPRQPQPKPRQHFSRSRCSCPARGRLRALRHRRSQIRLDSVCDHRP